MLCHIFQQRDSDSQHMLQRLFTFQPSKCTKNPLSSGWGSWKIPWWQPSLITNWKSNHTDSTTHYQPQTSDKYWAMPRSPFQIRQYFGLCQMPLSWTWEMSANRHPPGEVDRSWNCYWWVLQLQDCQTPTHLARKVPKAVQYPLFLFSLRCLVRIQTLDRSKLL